MGGHYASSLGTIRRDIGRRDVSCAIISSSRDAHAVTREDSPDRAPVRAAVKVLIGSQDAIARVEEGWTAGGKLHTLQHQPVGDCRAQSLSQIQQRRSPDFAIIVNLEPLVPKVRVRISVLRIVSISYFRVVG
jgi:hypothetical protein